MNAYIRYTLSALMGTLSLMTHADPNISVAAPRPPADGYHRMTWTITPEVVPTVEKSGFYWATQVWSMHGGHAIYTGIQPRLQGSNVVIFSAFGPGTAPLSPNCRSGADGGQGTSCSIAYPWQTGRTYQLEIRYIPQTAESGPAIEGSIVDTASGTPTATGRIAVPPEWGGFSSSAYMFDEYFPFNSGPRDASKRHCVPYVRYTASLPLFYRDDITYPTTVRNIRLDGGADQCSVAARTPNARATELSPTSYRIENGFLSAGH